MQNSAFKAPLFGSLRVYDTVVQPYWLSLEVIGKLLQNTRGRSENDFSRDGYIPLVLSNFRMANKLVQYFYDINSQKVFFPRRDVERDEYQGMAQQFSTLVSLRHVTPFQPVRHKGHSILTPENSSLRQKSLLYQKIVTSPKNLHCTKKS